MRSKASYFKVSLPLIGENLRRLWSIPALAFLVYFLAGVFPILMSYRSIDRVASYIEMSLNNLQPFFMAVHLLAPVLAATALFRYLQTAGSAAVMHSLPFTRSVLFNSNFLSGLLLAGGPVVLNGLLLLVIRKPAFRSFGYPPGQGIDPAAVDVFSAGAIGNWILTSLLIIAVLFTVAVFAAVVTGNSAVQLMASYFFIFLIPLLYAVFHIYFQEYLYGFDMSGDWVDVGLSISPYTAVLNNGGTFSGIEIAFYIATILVMAILSAFLYRRRKLERAGDALTVAFLRPVLSYIIAFLGMTLLGFYFKMLGDGPLYMYVGFAAGTLVFFLIGQMIVRKTVRIFDRYGMQHFLIYSVVAALFLVGLQVDATGFERRVPDPSRVEKATLQLGFGSLLDGSYRTGTEERGLLKDPANLEALARFHRSLLESRQRFEQPAGQPNTSYVRLAYDTGFPVQMNRNYSIDYAFFRDSPDLAAIVGSDEFKATLSLKELSPRSVQRITFYGDEYREGAAEIGNARWIGEFLAAYESDLQAMTFATYASLRPSYARADIQFTGSGGQQGYAGIRIPLAFTATIDWLEDHGYFFGVRADMVERIDIFPAGAKDYYYEEAKPGVAYDSAYPSSSYGRIPTRTVTDPAGIQAILDRYETMPLDYGTAYTVEIVYQPVVLQGDFVGPQILSGYLNEGLDFLD